MTTHDDTAPLLCGTYAGYSRHVRRGEPIDEDCRAAATLYQRLWRQRGGTERTRAYNAARSRALARLAGLHRDEYRTLYAEELTKGRRP